MLSTHSYDVFFLHSSSRVCIQLIVLRISQGSSSLTVSFPNRQAVVIKVSSLSANVASLKQIIAEVIQIPADKHKLSGKSGVLKDDNMTLAHYNVRDGDILTLSL
ncbi:hypothetical protein F2Q70_00032697 [Brassica cretica]|uniref:Ubiquitin-like domain-containing protein n=1 Tax=Brassica cretica TaxID=69181 RepID=A0A8S9FBW4_BRACR|nr:hypothetical protein F2Q70_00032697 [Brassica cretica]KAF2553270.1 hypothetical protein F2Q68_00037061 [Brassica cretica]